MYMQRSNQLFFVLVLQGLISYRANRKTKCVKFADTILKIFNLALDPSLVLHSLVLSNVM